MFRACPCSTLAFCAAGLLALLSLANSAEPKIDRILSTNISAVPSVEIHISTEANRMYVLQYINSLSCTNPALCNSNGVATNNWVNFKTFFAAPFTNHFIVHDTRTNKSRFYRLKATP